MEQNPIWLEVYKLLETPPTSKQYFKDGYVRQEIEEILGITQSQFYDAMKYLLFVGVVEKDCLHVPRKYKLIKPILS